MPATPVAGLQPDVNDPDKASPQDDENTVARPPVTVAPVKSPKGLLKPFKSKSMSKLFRSPKMVKIPKQLSPGKSPKQTREGGVMATARKPFKSPVWNSISETSLVKPADAVEDLPAIDDEVDLEARESRLNSYNDSIDAVIKRSLQELPSFSDDDDEGMPGAVIVAASKSFSEDFVATDRSPSASATSPVVAADDVGWLRQVEREARINSTIDDVIAQSTLGDLSPSSSPEPYKEVNMNIELPKAPRSPETETVFVPPPVVVLTVPVRTLAEKKVMPKQLQKEEHRQKEMEEYSLPEDIPVKIKEEYTVKGDVKVAKKKEDVPVKSFNSGFNKNREELVLDVPAREHQAPIPLCFLRDAQISWAESITPKSIDESGVKIKVSKKKEEVLSKVKESKSRDDVIMKAPKIRSDDVVVKSTKMREDVAVKTSAVESTPKSKDVICEKVKDTISKKSKSVKSDSHSSRVAEELPSTKEKSIAIVSQQENIVDPKIREPSPIKNKSKKLKIKIPDAETMERERELFAASERLHAHREKVAKEKSLTTTQRLTVDVRRID